MNWAVFPSRNAKGGKRDWGERTIKRRVKNNNKNEVKKQRDFRIIEQRGIAVDKASKKKQILRPKG